MQLFLQWILSQKATSFIYSVSVLKTSSFTKNHGSVRGAFSSLGFFLARCFFFEARWRFSKLDVFFSPRAFLQDLSYKMLILGPKCYRRRPSRDAPGRSRMLPGRATLYVNLRTMDLPRATLYVNLHTMKLPRANSYVNLCTMELPRTTLYVNSCQWNSPGRLYT